MLGHVALGTVDLSVGNGRIAPAEVTSYIAKLYFLPFLGTSL